MAAGGLLAACASPFSSGAPTTSSAPVDKALGDRLRAILGEPKNLLAKGPGSFATSAMFGLSGTGAGTGKAQLNGHRLGVDHLAAWTNGKLRLDTKVYDHKSGDPQATGNAARQAGLAHNPFMIMSFSFGFGVVPPIAKTYKFLALDPGGGTGPIFYGLPYCYGTRASWPLDPQDGLTKTIKALHPDAKRWAVVGAEVSEPWTNASKKYISDLYQREGIQLVTFQTAAVGVTDYSTLISQLKAVNPDVTVFMTFGDDPGYQAREVQRQQMRGIFAGSERQKESVAVAGNAFKDWYFGYDSLDVSHPSNDWTKLFLEEFAKTNQGTPGLYEAGYYVNVFNHALLMDHILGTGGDITKGDDYIKALEANPTFPHVYGGNGAALGKLTVDLQNHSVSAIPMIAFQDPGTGNYADTIPLATYNIKARDWKLIKS